MYVNANVRVSEEILLTLRESMDEFITEMKVNISVKYYIERKLSIGQCAELAEMTEEGFIKYLSVQKISIFNFESEADVLEDVKNT